MTNLVTPISGSDVDDSPSIADLPRLHVVQCAAVITSSRTHAASRCGSPAIWPTRSGGRTVRWRRLS
jgi:hypothetical protein